MKPVAVARSRTWTRVLIMLTVVGLLLTTVGAAPAYAAIQDRGRYCRTYYHLNNPATGWGFTVCVKLQYDSARRAWRGTGSVTTTTPGMVLHTANTHYQAYNVTRNTVQIYNASKGPAQTQILGITTPWHTCYQPGDTFEFHASVDEYVTWPNGVNSPHVVTAIDGNLPPPDDAWWLALCV